MAGAKRDQVCSGCGKPGVLIKMGSLKFHAYCHPMKPVNRQVGDGISHADGMASGCYRKAKLPGLS